MGGDGGGRGGVPPRRLEHDGGWLDPGGSQLLGDQETVGLVADDDRWRESVVVGDPAGGVLQQAVLTNQRQHLFRVQLARQRPQAGPRPTREDDWNDPAFRTLCHTRQSANPAGYYNG
jgi:hypothetical protein